MSKTGAVFTNLHGREVEVFYVLLLGSGKYSFLPDLYEIFGRESTIKFLEIFAGCKLKVPTVDQLERIARNTKVYTSVELAHYKRRAIVIENLALEFDTDETGIRQIHQRTKTYLEENLGFKVKQPRMR